MKLQTQKEILQTPAFLESGRIRTASRIGLKAGLVLIPVELSTVHSHHLGLHKQCGQKENAQIVWSNGSIWTREVTVADSIAEKKISCRVELPG